MAGLCAPLSTLRQYPRGHLRMTRGRCGSLLLHRDGLPPSTPCRSPGALRSTPESGLKSDIAPCLKSADFVAKVGSDRWMSFEHLSNGDRLWPAGPDALYATSALRNTKGMSGWRSRNQRCEP